MKVFQDHPDIEKLPLEIDGIPVRETIREIFRNPDNGRPDNISKAGDGFKSEVQHLIR